MGKADPVTLPYRWSAQGAHHKPDGPAVGDLIPLEHRVYRVVAINPRDEVDWEPGNREALEAYRPEFRYRYIPRIMVLRPLGEQTKNRDKHYLLGGRARFYYWDVYPNEHYPVCAQCLEPVPCRDQMAEKVSVQASNQMTRYEVAGVCPACREVVSHRQKRVSWPDNVEIPGGPPVTFHMRLKCLGSAMEYEKRWVAADPNARRARFSCKGHVTNHNDGTYACTELQDCPGPQARHPSYTVCSCPDCHARGGFGCYPSASARNVWEDV